MDGDSDDQVLAHEQRSVWDTPGVGAGIGRHVERTSRDLSRPRVLIVEDNLINQKVAARMVTRLGYRVDVVENGAEAVKAVSRIAYAAVLMDCEMPEMDGYEATRRIRQADPPGRQVPIIALTARVQPEDRQWGLAVGMNEYLSKPICAYALAVALERWVQAVACCSAEGC